MRNNWTRDELILAFNLYCKLPYGQFNNRNAEVIKLAEILGRSPGAIAYKLVNFVSLDPKQKLLGRKGATNIGKIDKEVFIEFTQNFDELFVESEKLLEQKTNDIIETPIDVEIKIDETKKGENKVRVTTARKNQDYFRSIVLSNYTFGCALTGITIPELLIASHIKPWSKDEKNRLNPANGICLSATLDRAFDKGLISINKDFEVIFSNKLKRYSKESFFENEIRRFENIRMNLPIKFLPGDEFIEFHNDVVFQK